MCAPENHSAPASEAFKHTLEYWRGRADQALLEHLPEIRSPHPRLAEAMHYAVTVGGKRIRPVLCYLTGQALGVESHRLDASAAALEMMHAYSLVHDDLPAMDDDDLRRGQPTCHIRFDEATAILAGDALQAHAFSLLCDYPDPELGPDQRLSLLSRLGQAIGAEGMALGQAIDLAAVGQTLDLEALEAMHRHKTGALIRASAALAVIVAQADAETTRRIDLYAGALGLGFQIVDDILDETADTDTLGKTQGADRARNKPTYPALLGLSGARDHAHAMHQTALNSLAGLGPKFEPLRALSHWQLHRQH